MKIRGWGSATHDRESRESVVCVCGGGNVLKSEWMDRERRSREGAGRSGKEKGKTHIRKAEMLAAGSELQKQKQTKRFTQVQYAQSSR